MPPKKHLAGSDETNNSLEQASPGQQAKAYLDRLIRASESATVHIDRILQLLDQSNPDSSSARQTEQSKQD